MKVQTMKHINVLKYQEKTLEPSISDALTASFSTVTRKARTQCDNIFNVLRENNCQPKLHVNQVLLFFLSFIEI